MKICVYGAGAIGGQIGACLTQAGVDVSLVARGAHLAAMQQRGLTLISGEERFTVRPKAVRDPAVLGPQDVVIVALKAHSAPAAVEAMQPLLAPETTVVTAMNGVPWWYFHGLAGAHAGHRLESVDPGGLQWDGIGPERAIGCVLWQANEIAEPGVVKLTFDGRMLFGEPDGSRSDRVVQLCRTLQAAGLASEVVTDIRAEIWMKLWGNLSFNPVSVLTHASLGTLATDPGSRAVIKRMMTEARDVVERLDIRFTMDLDTRIDAAKAVGAHKSSMLQDLERGRPIELEALTGVVVELGHLVGVPTPTIEMIYGLTRQRAREAGCYPEQMTSDERNGG